MPSFRVETHIDAEIARCFDLSLSVDAHTASMGDSAERAVGGTVSGVLGLGDSVTWEARHFGLPFRMTAQVVEYDEPTRFVDEQTRGPFRHWRHVHEFADDPRGGTTMTDAVEFSSPYGLLGTAVDRLVLTRYLSRLITERNRWLRETLQRSS